MNRSCFKYSGKQIIPKALDLHIFTGDHAEIQQHIASDCQLHKMPGIAFPGSEQRRAQCEAAAYVTEIQQIEQVVLCEPQRNCHCFKQQAIDLIYTQSNIKDILARENFSTLSLDYYSDSNVNPATGLTSLATAKAAVARCHEFVDQFDATFANLYFFGDTGIGKTFLSNCIAKELLDSGHSVIYFTAFQLFDILSKGVFAKDEEAIAANENIFTCDLLIIDDLGTELTNSFTTSQLFLCLNERILHRKSTIISTNLGLSQLTDLYSERILSRIMDNYVLIKLFGEDIRMQKRRR